MPEITGYGSNLELTKMITTGKDKVGEVATEASGTSTLDTTPEASSSGRSITPSGLGENIDTQA